MACYVKASERRIYLAVLLAAPLLILLLNRNWPFGGFGDYDAFYYLGFFIHFPHYQILRNSYPGERLPWILPGYALVHLFGAVYGNLILHLLCVYAATLSLNSMVTRFAGAQAGFLAALALSIHPYFLAANGMDYVMGGCIAYCLITFALLVRAGDSGARARWALLIAAGMSWAAVIYTYPFWALFTPACVSVYWAAKARVSMRDTISAAMAFAVGCALITAAMMSVHFLIFHRGGLDFVSNSLGTARFLSTMRVSPWVTSDRLFFLYADWLVFPGAAALIAILLLTPLGRHWPKMKPGTVWLLLAYLYFAAVMILATIHPERRLSFDYYASFLLPGAFLVFGVTIFDTRMEFERRWFWVVVTLAALVTLAPLAKPGLYTKPPILGAVLPAMLLTGALAIRFARPGSVAGTMVMALGFAEAAFCLAPVIGGDAWRTRTDLRASTGRIAEVVRNVEGRLPWDRYPAFWYDEGSPNHLEFQAIMCSFLAGGESMLQFPQIPPGEKYPHGQVLILLVDRPGVFVEASAAMQARGMPLSFLWEQPMANSGTPYWVIAAAVQ